MSIDIRKYALMAAVVTVAALLPGIAAPLGLGPIQSDSRIGQPLNARIPLIAADANALQGLAVGLAASSAYKQAGLSVPDFLFSLKFQVKRDAGGPYVLVTSQQPVRLPFVNLLVHANWSSGELTRQYTILLNPPMFASGGLRAGAAANARAGTNAAVALVSRVPAAPTVRHSSSAIGAGTPRTRPSVEVSAPSSQPTVQASARPDPSPLSSSQPPVVLQPPATQSSRAQPFADPNAPLAASARPASQRGENAASQPQSYGPVAYGSTLWSLASRLRPAGIGVKQMMIALYRANPQAFSGNISRLLAGTELRVPSRSEVEEISRSEAVREVAEQEREWQSSRTGGNGASQGTVAGIAGAVSGASSPRQAAAEQTLSTTAAAAGTLTATGAAGAVFTAGAGVVAAAGSTSIASSAVLAGHATIRALTAAGASTRSAVAGGNGAAATGSSAVVADAVLAAPQTTGALAAAAGGLAAVQNDHPAGPVGAGNTTDGTHPGNAANVSDAANPVSARQRAGSTIENWLGSPKGWVVIGLIGLLIVLLLIYSLHRRAASARTQELAASAASAANAEDEVGQPDFAADTVEPPEFDRDTKNPMPPIRGQAPQLAVEPLLSALYRSWEKEAGDAMQAENRANAKLKLDLARAYLKLGYRETAHDIIQEVLGESVAV